MSTRALKNIVFLCPSIAEPQGGVKVICRHAQLIDELRHLGVAAQVLFPLDPNFELSWFASKFSRRRDLSFDPSSDLVIIPEVMTDMMAAQLRQVGISYGIFVQNGYYVFNGIGGDGKSMSALRNSYLMSTVVSSISDDTSSLLTAFVPKLAEKIHKVQYSIDDTMFAMGPEKQKVITFMPRKLPFHASITTRMLARQLPPTWRIEPIHGLDEQGVAQLLQKSRIFMAFSEFEGCPVPPLEAAFSGNRVIGYTGQGGLEYWEDPIFTEVKSGDIMGFIRAVLDEVAHQDLLPPSAPDGRKAEHLSRLRARYSAESERQSLAAFIEAAASAFANA